MVHNFDMKMMDEPCREGNHGPCIVDRKWLLMYKWRNRTSQPLTSFAELKSKRQSFQTLRSPFTVGAVSLTGECEQYMEIHCKQAKGQECKIAQ